MSTTFWSNECNQSIMYNVEIINYCQSFHVDHSIYIIYLFNMEHFGALLNLVNLPMHIELFSRVSLYWETMELLANLWSFVLFSIYRTYQMLLCWTVSISMWVHVWAARLCRKSRIGNLTKQTTIGKGNGFPLIWVQIRPTSDDGRTECQQPSRG